MEIVGVFLAVLGGVANGSYPVAKTYLRGWADGQVWAAFSACTFFLVPLIVICLHHTGLQYLSHNTLAILIATGILFSIGMVCFTLSLKKIGLAPSFSLNIIINTTIGTLLPLFLFHCDQALSMHALLVYIGVILFVASIGFMYSALPAGTNSRSTKEKFIGVMLGVFSGAFTSLQSTAYNYAIHNAPAAISSATNKLLVWSIFFLSSFFVFFAYHIFTSRKQLRSFAQFKMSNTLLIVVMAFLYFVSIFLFSWSTRYISVPVAWPLFMTAIVLCTNCWGIKFDELSGVMKKNYMTYIALTILAFGFFGFSMRLGG